MTPARPLPPFWAVPLIAALIGASACVSLEEAPMTAGAVQAGQRVVLVVHAAPGPLVAETDTKADTAAKILPGLGLVVQSAQDERLKGVAKDLAQYLPAWKPEESLYAALTETLAGPGRPAALTPAAVGVATETFRVMNAAVDPEDWRARYYLDSPDYPRLRNYAGILSLDDALILEVNLVYGAVLDPQTNAVPTVSAVTRLVRANSLHRLWRKEETVDDQAGARQLYEFKLKPADLVAAWEKLVAALGKKVADDYALSLASGGLAGSRAGGAATSSGTVSGLGPEGLEERRKAAEAAYAAAALKVESSSATAVRTSTAPAEVRLSTGTAR